LSGEVPLTQGADHHDITAMAGLGQCRSFADGELRRARITVAAGWAGHRGRGGELSIVVERAAKFGRGCVAIVRLTGVPAVVVVRAGDDGGIARLRRAGAWLVINPVAIAGCFAGESGISK
jgi:hypothetical protein